MSVLAECPHCHRKQKLSNKKCTCGADLDNLKKAKKVKYWVNYRGNDGKQKRRCEGLSLELAKAADGKVKGKKAEGSILEITNEARMTFSELIDWYLNLSDVKKLKSFERAEDALENIRAVFGKRYINTVKPLDLSSYQEMREKAGRAAATIDMELSIAKTMITKAFDNDIVSGRTLKTFRNVKKLLKKGSNARERTLSIKEYVALLRVAPQHLKSILIVAMNTGMRRGEILGLRWYQVGKDGFIRLDKNSTKEKKDKTIPINANVKEVLEEIPRAVHHDYVFTYRGESIAMGIRKSLKATCKQVGIEYGMNVKDGFRFHDLRTTVKTNMLVAGLDKAIRDTLVGHSLKGMDVYYIKPSDDDLRKAMDTYTAWLDQEVEKSKVDYLFDQTTPSAE